MFTCTNSSVSLYSEMSNDNQEIKIERVKYVGPWMLIQKLLLHYTLSLWIKYLIYKECVNDS